MKKILPFILSICLVVISVAAFAQGEAPSSDYVRGITPGRARALVGVALGLISVVIGWRAKKKSGDRRSAIVAIVFASVAVIINILHILNTSGGFGTGGGKAGAIVGIVLGISGLTVGGIALMRSRKNA